MNAKRLSAAALLMLCLLLAATSTAAIRHVRPDHPLASDDGDGGAQRPWRTLSHAARHLQPGDTLLIAAGIYRDSLVLPQRAWSASTPTTIAGEGLVELRGTDLVGGWERLGGGVLVKHGWNSEPQQVVVHGKLLVQAGGTVFDGYPQRGDHPLAGLHRGEGGIWPGRTPGGLAALTPGGFWYDSATRSLYLRLPATTALPEIEVATRTWLLRAENVSGLVVRNLRFRYANTSTMSRQGAVTIKGHGNTLEMLAVLDADGVGIELEGDGNVIRQCTVMRAGYLGIKARGAQNLIADNRVSHNNVRGFNKWWEAGGMKFIGNGGLRQSRVAANEVAYNNGDGIWFDWGNDDNQVERNRVAYNTGFGVHYEASARGVITQNRIFGNGQRGVYLSHSRDSVVTRNLIVANGLEGIVAIDEQRTDPQGLLDLRPWRNRISGNVLAWNKGPALILPGARYRNVSDDNVYLQDDAEPGPLFAMGWPKTWNRPQPISAWRAREGQDIGSRVISKRMEATMRNALAQRSLEIDFSRIERLAGAAAPALAGQARTSRSLPR
ncbi:right-handed parallel beta-helix repeat-containing protein [Lacisediminimonas sp.]|uniref:right-handed parallel beta-helix repeat-containing protein n=1 Tax=Lacisediminimonas sp. TaxID=3060582 RepID=UPI0027277DC8|nr:right-handed parallel beta-helix repeat-containing protein [Lacisediminimonas sp.]MDO8300773.1 right-handed parallel beta-helix repeat-containing protein [Lacisediminimonas sp.]